MLSTVVANINGTDLLDSTIFTSVAASTTGVTAGLSTGDYTLLVANTPGSGGLIDTASINSYDVSFAGYGDFNAMIGAILSQNANFLDARMRVGLNLSGESASYSSTLASPPEELVPEPGTYTLMAGGLLSLFALRRKKA